MGSWSVARQSRRSLHIDGRTTWRAGNNAVLDHRQTAALGRGGCGPRLRLCRTDEAWRKYRRVALVTRVDEFGPKSTTWTSRAQRRLSASMARAVQLRSSSRALVTGVAILRKSQISCTASGLQVGDQRRTKTFFRRRRARRRRECPQPDRHKPKCHAEKPSGGLARPACNGSSRSNSSNCGLPGRRQFKRRGFWQISRCVGRQDVDLVNAALAGVERDDHEHHGNTHLASEIAVTTPVVGAPA